MKKKKQDNYKEKAMQLYDKLDSINADLSELDMYDEASQKKIISDYKRTMNQYKKLTGEVPKEYVRDIDKIKETRGLS